MLGIDERALRIVWTVFLFGLTLALIYFLRDTLLVFALAVFLAYMLSPLVTIVSRILPRRRNLALAVVYTLLIGLLVLLGFLVVPRVAEQATNLAGRLPALLTANRLATIPLPTWLEPARVQAISVFNSEVSQVGARVVPFVREAGARILSGIGALLPAILIPILAFFFLKDGESLRNSILGAVDDGHDRGLLEQILDDIHLMLRNYIRALVMMSISAFVFWALFLSILGYPYELLLAGLAGVLEFIPVVGPVSGAAIMLLVCAVTGSGGLLWIIVFFLLYRVFADYILSPYLMSSGVEIHPLLVLFGVLAGESIAGIPGMFFSVPAIAILRVLYLNLQRTYKRRHTTLTVQESV
jgi:predicted PurR-regulated permease PerM